MITMSTRRFRRSSIVVAASLLALTAACAADDGNTSGSGTTSSAAVDEAKEIVATYSAAIEEFPAVEPVDGVDQLAGMSVWYVPVATAPPAFQVYADSLIEALSSVGVDVQVCDGQFVPTAIAACLEQAGSSNADAVVTGYVDYELVSQAVDGLVEKGVKVLLGGQAVPDGAENSADLAFHDTIDQQNLGQELSASAIIADSNGEANILYISTPDSQTLEETANHAVDYLEEKCPGCKVTRIEYSSASLDKLPSQVSAALIKEPGIDYIFAELDTAIPFAITGARSAGYEDKVKIAGMGADLAVVQGIADGGPAIATAGSFLSYTSWMFADDVIRMLVGEVPAEEGFPVPYRLFTADNSADLALTPEGYSSMEWYGSDAYQQQFLTAWGVS